LTIGKGTAKSKSGDWWTPKDLYKSICKMLDLHPQLDVAATPSNTLCRYYITKAADSLKQEWTLGDRKPEYVDVWCNPPGDEVQLFIDKAIEQWMRHNINIVMLVPVNTIANKKFEVLWDIATKQAIHRLIEIYPLFGIRPKFLLEGKIQKFGSRNGFIVLVFRKR